MSNTPTPPESNSACHVDVGVSPDQTWRWSVPGVLLIGYAIFSYLLTPMGGRSFGLPDAAYEIVFGAILVQPVLIGMWASLTDRTDYQRYSAGAGACMFIILFEGMGAVRSGIIDSNLLLVSLVFYLTTTFLLLPVRELCDYRLGLAGTFSKSGPYAGRQFGIRHLLIATFLVAAVVGLLRFLVAPSGPFASALEQLLTLAVYVAMVFPPCSIPWTMLVCSRDAKSKYRTLVLVGAGTLACGTSIAILSTIPYLPPGITVRYLAMAQAGAAVTGFLSAVILRRCGYQIVSLS